MIRFVGLFNIVPVQIRYVYLMFLWHNVACFSLAGCIENNIDYFGEDINYSGIKEIQGCMEECANNQECQFWTMNTTNNACYLKKEGAINNRKVQDGIVSGTKLCPGKFQLVEKLVLEYVWEFFE